MRSGCLALVLGSLFGLYTKKRIYGLSTSLLFYITLSKADDPTLGLLWCIQLFFFLSACIQDWQSEAFYFHDVWLPALIWSLYRLDDIQTLVLALGICLGIWLLARIMQDFYHQPMLGQGDLWFFYTMLLSLNVPLALLAIWLACVGGLFYLLLTKRRRLAFVPFLCLGWLIVLWFNMILGFVANS